MDDDPSLYEMTDSAEDSDEPDSTPPVSGAPPPTVPVATTTPGRTRSGIRAHTTVPQLEKSVKKYLKSP